MDKLENLVLIAQLLELAEENLNTIENEKEENSLSYMQNRQLEEAMENIQDILEEVNDAIEREEEKENKSGEE